MRILLLAIALLFARNVAAQSQEQSPILPKASHKPEANPKQHAQGAATDQRGTENTPLFITVIPPLAAEPEPPQKTQNHNDYTSPEWWLVWVTLILAAITAILARYTAKLWGATKALSEDAKRTADRQAGEMQESLEIAERSAAAANKMAVTMEDTAERQLRAYVLVFHVKVINDPEPEHPGQYVYIDVRNFGQTPAAAVSYWIDMDAKERSLATVLKRIRLTKNKSVGVIAPGDTFTARVPIPLLSDGNEIFSGTHALYVFGQFRYTDAFNRERATNFRYMRSGEHWTSDGQMEICDDGNDAT
jgi:hypothetical protein